MEYYVLQVLSFWLSICPCVCPLTCLVDMKISISGLNWDPEVRIHRIQLGLPDDSLYSELRHRLDQQEVTHCSLNIGWIWDRVGWQTKITEDYRQKNGRWRSASGSVTVGLADLLSRPDKRSRDQDLDVTSRDPGQGLHPVFQDQGQDQPWCHDPRPRQRSS